MNDRPLLEGVGRPVAVNPHRYLRQLAVERGWPVQDFRTRRRLWLIWLPAGVAAGITTAAAAVTGRRLARKKRRRPSGKLGILSARPGRRAGGRPR